MFSSKYNLMGDLCFCNSMLVYNIGDTKIQSLESWIKTYKGFAWGWKNGKELVLADYTNFFFIKNRFFIFNNYIFFRWLFIYCIIYV